MLRLDETLCGHSLADLLEVRQDLRRQEILLQGAIDDLRLELDAWHRHETGQMQISMPVAAELQRVRNELAAREHELSYDLVQVRHAHFETCREIQNQLGRPRTAAG